MPGLRLHAVDAEDLGVLAAQLQDAVATVGDMAYVPAQRRFACMLNRFKWEDLTPSAGPKPDKDAPFRRVRTALHFDGVMNVKVQGLRLSDKAAIVNVLTLEWKPGTDGAGVMTIVLSGNAAIRLELECLDAWLKDVSEPWSTPNKPSHGEGADEPLG